MRFSQGPKPLSWEASEVLADLVLVPMPPDEALLDLVRALIRESVGCGIYGMRFRWTVQLRDALARLFDTGEVPFWGTRQKSSPRGAVLGNATQVHAFEWDDQCLGAGLHAGSATVPTALAVARLLGGVSGQRLLEGVWAGSEAGARVGLLLGDAAGRRGFHIHGWTGAIASAATAARILQLDRPSTMRALGTAASLGAGLQGAQYGADTKRLHAGRAAESGLVAALLAAEGFSGVEGFLERPHGGLVSSLGGPQDPQEVARRLEQLGSGPLLPSVLAFKQVPCKIGVQAPYSLLNEIVADNSLDENSISSVMVSVSPYVAASSGRNYDPREPQTAMSAQASIQYALARLLRGDAVGPASFEQGAIRDCALLHYLKLISIEADPAREGAAPEIRWGASVTVVSHQGTYSADSSAGIPGFPGYASTDWLSLKFRSSCRAVIGERQTEMLDELFDDLHNLQDSRVIDELVEATYEANDILDEAGPPTEK
jgi:aconitate decarboxylase